MRLFHKIFLCFVVIFSITFQMAGILLINFSYGNALEQEKKYAIQEYQYNKYILQSLMYSDENLINGNLEKIIDRKKIFTCNFAIYTEQEKCLFSSLSANPKFDFSDIKEDAVYQLYNKSDENYIFVYGILKQNERSVYLVTETGIDQVINSQRRMIPYFQKIFLVILFLAFPMIGLLSSFLTQNISKVSKGSKRIAMGNFSERISVTGKDEIADLAENFNQMAESVEEKVQELSDAAKQKEDFTANFAHELKTPLTSVIGYADMIYQKDLSREQVKSAAEYILNEGMRLEALSLKLMDLFVLDKQEFYLETVNVREVFDNFVPDIEMLCEKKCVSCHLELEHGEIAIDFDLFKTLIMNVLDNAVKADCKDIWIFGKKQEEEYGICIKDNGKGIPTDEIGRITESFYMVDKSRARKQHGAGLGMALVKKIAKVHNGEMKIESDGCTGTSVLLTFKERV